ncbi:hypothetical protein CP061683_1448B, partial [Chlamydia psittaci 06-1683]
LPASLSDRTGPRTHPNKFKFLNNLGNLYRRTHRFYQTHRLPGCSPDIPYLYDHDFLIYLLHL